MAAVEAARVSEVRYSLAPYPSGLRATHVATCGGDEDVHRSQYSPLAWFLGRGFACVSPGPLEPKEYCWLVYITATSAGGIPLVFPCGVRAGLAARGAGLAPLAARLGLLVLANHSTRWGRLCIAFHAQVG